jgi:MoxR-like ATPase
MSDKWKIFRGEGQPHDGIQRLLDIQPPKWRRFAQVNQAGQALAKDADYVAKDEQYRAALLEKANSKLRDVERGQSFRLRNKQGEVRDRQRLIVDAVNAALYLRRPLLVTGKPGAGKTSLAYAVAWELKLGSVLSWSVTARSSLQDGLYLYDAIARLQDANLLKANEGNDQPTDDREIDPLDIGQYIRLGPVGTAFLPSRYPRVLLIDEVDKSDINLPNDLLNLLEEGSYSMPELKRLSKRTNQVQTVETDDDLDVDIPQGQVQCDAFPLVIMTSNGEREFPAAFYRRCLRVQMPPPEEEELIEIVEAHLEGKLTQKVRDAIKNYAALLDSEEGNLATDQLLNLIYLMKQGADRKNIEEIVLQALSVVG